MAVFQGFRCDSCGEILASGDRTRKVVRYEGPVVEGDYTQDLCPDCVAVPDGITLRPIRRRRKGSRAEAPADAEPQAEQPQEPLSA